MAYINTNYTTHLNVPSISVVLPVFNCEKYVGYCIESILNQTYTNFELIIIDDGSTDLSLKICSRFSGDKRIRIYHQSNMGLSYARNVGIEKATNNYIFFVDSDDYIHRESLAYLSKIFIKTGADIIVSDFLCVNDHKMMIDSLDKFEYYDVNSYNIIDELLSFPDTHGMFKYATVWGKLINATLLRKYPFPNGKFWEDIFVMYKLYEEANCIVEMNKILYFYFQNNAGITGSPFSRRNLDYLDGMIERLHYIKETHCGLYNKALAQYAHKCSEFYNKALESGDIFIINNISARLHAL